MSDEDPWEAARARTREDVRQIFARTPEAPQRMCPHCGARAQTREEHCPACGRSYFERPDRFSPRTRRLLQGVGALAAAAVLALVVVVLIHLAGDNGTSARERRAAAAAAERAPATGAPRGGGRAAGRGCPAGGAPTTRRWSPCATPPAPRARRASSGASRSSTA